MGSSCNACIMFNSCQQKVPGEQAPGVTLLHDDAQLHLCVRSIPSLSIVWCQLASRCAQPAAVCTCICASAWLQLLICKPVSCCSNIANVNVLSVQYIPHSSGLKHEMLCSHRHMWTRRQYTQVNARITHCSDHCMKLLMQLAISSHQCLDSMLL